MDILQKFQNEIIELAIKLENKADTSSNKTENKFVKFTEK